MPEQNPDLELQAIQTILSAFEPLDDEARQRVISYILQRVKLPVATSNPDISSITSSIQSAIVQTPTFSVTDIRTLKTQKTDID